MSDIDDTVTADVFGLDGCFPCPGWRVLDAARSRRFTGEVTCATIPVTKVYFDAGEIYFAERASDPSLGARLVDAGALTATQLEQGSMFVGGIAHLGRLFERVGSVDRHQVLLVAELMTEERVGWLAGRLVAGIALAPYRHHPTGVRRWAWPTEPSAQGTAAPLPAPSTGAMPIGSVAPESWPAQRPPALPDLVSPIGSVDVSPIGSVDVSPMESVDVSPIGSVDGGTIGSDQPSVPERGGVPAASPLVPPAVGAEPFPAPAGALRVALTTPPKSVADADASTPARSHDPVGRFELIWPSGEVDDQVELAPRIDTGPTPEPGLSTSLLSVLHDVAAGANSVDSTIEQQDRTPLPDMNVWIEASGDSSDDSSDEVALAVRRAVAMIETGSLDARRRFVATPMDGDRSPGDERDMMSTPIAGSLRRASARSVFDDAHTVEDTYPDDPQVEEVEPDWDDGDERAGALRRLIDSMRRG